MKQYLSLFLAVFTFFAMLSPSHGQSSDMLVTAGTTVSSPVDGVRWAYIFWQASTPEILSDYHVAIYAKDGGGESLTPFVRRALFMPVDDTRTLNARIRRAIHVGDDLDLLESRLGEVFAPLTLPEPAEDRVDLALAQKIGSILLAARDDPSLWPMLSTMGRVHPAIGLAQGTAFTEPISGVRTYEVRLYSTAGAALGVVGRVTLDGAAPVALLPAPAAPVNILPDTTGMNAHARRFRLQTMDLVARLRWGAPPELARLSALRHGYRLYRVERGIAESHDWHLAPPPPGSLAAAEDGATVVRVTEAPILPDVDYTPAEAANMADGDFFYVDDLRMEMGEAFVHGSQYYYFVAALDILGREGEYSEGTLVTMLNRLPPEAPVNVKVEEEFQWDQSLGADERLLRIRWEPDPPVVIPGLEESTRVRGPSVYHVFRWQNAEEFVRYPSTLQVSFTNDAGRMFGRITPEEGLSFEEGEPLHFLDNTPDRPNTDDARQVFWYTVMRVELGPDGEPLNLSAHSAPASGVIRAFLALEAPAARVFYDNAIPVVVTNTVPAMTMDDGDDAQGLITLSVSLTNSAPHGLEWIELALGDDDEGTLYEAPTGNATWTLQISLSPFEYMDLTNSLQAVSMTMIGMGDVRSETAFYPGDELPNVLAEYIKYGSGADIDVSLGFASSMDVTRVSTDDVDTILVGIPYPNGYPNADGSPNPIFPRGEADYPVGTVEYRVYRSIDGGDLVLVEAGLIEDLEPPEDPIVAPAASGGDDLVQVQNDVVRITMPFGGVESVIPPVPEGGNVCYFVQGIDIDGNASPVTQTCLDVPPDTTLVGERSRFIPTMHEPVFLGGGIPDSPGPARVQIRWNLSAQNIERFDLLIAPHGNPLPEAYDVPGLGVKVGERRMRDSDGQRRIFGRYSIRPERARQYDNGSIVPGLYGIELPVAQGRTYSVRVTAVVRNSGTSFTGEFITFYWNRARGAQSPPSPEDPVLPWLAQPMPAISDFHLPVRASFLENVNGFTGVGVRIGAIDFKGDTDFIQGPYFGTFDLGGRPTSWIRGRWSPKSLLYTYAHRRGPHQSPVREVIFPFVLYRYRVPAGGEDDMDLLRQANVIQVSPLREDVIVQYSADEFDDITIIRDPFIVARPLSGTEMELYVTDTQPVIRGESYRYVLVRFDELGEIAGLYRVPAENAFGETSSTLQIPE